MFDKMNKIFLGLIISCVVTGTVNAQHNALTPEEAKSGYDLLFNGTNLSNWHAYRQSAVTDAWTVKSDGVLGPRIQNGPGIKLPILTNNTYQNFDLRIDVQVTPNGNSGIFVRYQEVAVNWGNTRSGPEIQVCGPTNSDCQTPIHAFGTCYEIATVRNEVKDSWSKGPGVWNEIRVIAFDSNYVHYGNGVKLLEYKIGTPEFIVAYNQSKYKSDGNNGNYYDIHPGGIMLQHHDEEGMAFRNIKAKTLTIHPFLQEFPGGWPDSLPQSFVMGKRGCMDKTATNFDVTAEVDNGSCVASGIPKELATATRQLQFRNQGSGIVNLTVPFKHSKVMAYTLNGETVSVNHVSSHEYHISSKSDSGVIWVKIESDLGTITKKWAVQ